MIFLLIIFIITSCTFSSDITPLFSLQKYQVKFQGWKEVKSVGSVNPSLQSTGLSSFPRFVQISWEHLEVQSKENFKGYVVFRSESVLSWDLQNPLNKNQIIDPKFSMYVDYTVVSGQTYFYRLAAVIDEEYYFAQSNFGDHILEVTIPFDNMALVHRWMVNKDTCNLMNKLHDRLNNYRCEYFGAGGNSGYFDIGYSFFIDIFEMGCNYTPAPGCGDFSNGCIGTLSNPAGIVNAEPGDIYYSRRSGVCYVNTGASNGSIWTSANNLIQSSHKAIIGSKKPGLPPLVMISQSGAHSICQSQNEIILTSSRSLPSHKEQIAAGIWHDDIASDKATEIENGINLLTTKNCNSNQASGLNYENNSFPSNIETLPGCLNGNCFDSTILIRSLRTGSPATLNCESKFGIRDLIGNVNEWSSDQLSFCDGLIDSCYGQQSSIDTFNKDWIGLAFDGLIGPGGGGISITEWSFFSKSFSAQRFVVPLGLPVLDTSFSYQWAESLLIQEGAVGLDPKKINEDFFSIYTDNFNGTPARGAFGGGSWQSGSAAGRFYLNLFAAPSAVNVSRGFRCILRLN